MKFSRMMWLKTILKVKKEPLVEASLVDYVF